MAENHFRPPQISSAKDKDHITQGVEALVYLDAVKNSSSTFDSSQPRDDPSAPSCQRLHSVIIDVLMAYIIFQTHYLTKAPLTPAQKKANNRANRAPTTSATKPGTAVDKTPADLANISADALQNLQKYQGKQNFQPLVYFFLAGVRGLFITSRDHRIAGTSTCMSFIQAMSIIRQHSTTPHTPEESIWKNLSNYLVHIFLPVFQSPENICPLSQLKVPTRFELAEAITNDFLTQWQALNPTSPFLLPHTPPKLTNK
ncbi:hypothetical protein PTTG_29688 [Puccinia triticina 1-1 BBBD Race 1]|uniref:Uncharacterized protein n=1 Tax=Puccinia triticina (isolate 1-1 / race 1 (BBBD)) TaxID=630390 RepID=A0A180G2Q5_PUCT1|nr:hypothetical protein PTTG_29688 [Puccinia triticina 1-1 BBBD Race 1]